MPVYFYDSYVGEICIEDTGGSISHIYIKNDPVPANAEVKETPMIRETKAHLDAYFAGDLKKFSVPLAPIGTPYLKKVWALLTEIPYGEVITYRQLAERTGNPNATRAVGRANGLNPIPIIVPCHRVIGSNGTLTGFTGGLDMKRKLLELEGWKG